MNGYEHYMAMLKGAPVVFILRPPILMQFAAERIGADNAAFASGYRVNLYPATCRKAV